MLDELRALDGGSRPSAREVWRETVTYFENQGASDGLPEVRGQGLADRLGPGGVGVQDGRRPAPEGAGMRWGEQGSDGVCHLRALFLSEKGQWDAFWARPRKAG